MLDTAYGSVTGESGAHLPPDLQVVSFGVDSQGRLYLVDLGGSVYRLESGN